MKKLCLILALVLALSVVLCSCGNKNTDYDFDLKEYITLGEYPKVDFDEEDLKEELDKAVEQIASNYKTTAEVKDRPVADGDVVNIDYVGKMNGEEFEGGKATGADLKIGSDTYIAGFEDGLIGKKLGEEVVLNLVFPEDYTKSEYAGKDVEFTVKINKITSETIPELTDKMVSEKTEYKTVEEFIKESKKSVGESMLWEKYVASCKVEKYPQAETKNYYDKLIESYSQSAVYYGMTLEQMAKSYYGYSDMDTFLASVLDSAKGYVKEEMVILLTVKEKNITISDSEYKTRGEELAKDAGYKNLKAYEKAAGREAIELQINLEKIIDTLATENGLSDVKYEVPAGTKTEPSETTAK